ncbi:hypothetical protein [uncultured Pontibacter sp.]|uniref:hypothetical protein n=1 Tax=uncultured Pontibacter sp. TaxID=453356 RepID=UPI00260CD4A3|nr:hypothetical protein [uncultured Pontibacter sp.]
MRKNVVYIIGSAILGVAGCTSLSEGQQNLPEGAITQQRVRYNGDASMDIRERMNEQSSEINRKRNIEEFDRNGPATTPPALRPQQLPISPVDSTRHNIYWPIRPVIRPIQVNRDE